MGGIAGTQTRFEQIEIQNAICKADTTVPPNWNVTVIIKNTGTVDVTFISIFINEIQVDDYDQADTGYTYADVWATNMTNTETVTKGATIVVMIYIDPDKASSTLSSGTMVNIKLHSAGGNDFPKLIQLI
jgi:hypothetical protein